MSNNNLENIRLVYPLEMYYPNGVEGMVSEAEEAAIIAAYRDYEERIGKPIDPNDKHAAVQAFNLMLEKVRQNDYFSGVREIVNLLLSRNRTPEEIFRNLYPENKDSVEDFKCQFADACDLILLKDQVNWKAMNLPWYDFSDNEGKI